MRVIKCKFCQKEFMLGTRSNSQNNFLHSILNEIANHIGEQTKEDVLMAVGCSEYRPNVLTGAEQLYRKSTSKMTAAECSELCDKIRHWAREFLGLVIPDP